jgi:hypothetical protein
VLIIPAEPAAEQDFPEAEQKAFKALEVAEPICYMLARFAPRAQPYHDVRSWRNW